MGKSKYDAALHGASEMFPAVVTATATTIFAFLPILLMTGETGVFLRILPIMITILILSSLLEAFYFLPLHAMHTFKINEKPQNENSSWKKFQKLYTDLLLYLLERKRIALTIFITFILVFTIVLTKYSKFQFMPEFDTTQIFISGSIGAGHDIEQTQTYLYDLEKKLLQNFIIGDDIDSISGVVGMKLDGKQLPQMQEFYFQIFINLKEAKPINLFDTYINPILSPKYDATNMTREKTAQQIAKQMHIVLKDDLNNSIYKELTIKVPGAGIVKNDIEMTFSGNNKDVRETIKKIKKELLNIKGVANVADDILLGNYDLKFTVNSYGLSLGFNETNIINTLKPYYFKAGFSKMYDDSGIVDIVFQSKNKNIKSSLDNFELSIPNSTQKININDVVIFHKTQSLSQLLKENGKKIQSVTASLDGITSNEVYKILDKTLHNLPNGLTVKIKGEQKENKKVKMEMSQAFIIALVLIFISLIVMFDSLLKSFLILSTIPLSIFGVLVGHIIMGLNLTMPGVIGIIGLAGVIVNDGIIMMDFIQKAKSIQEIKKYALLRIRPIMLTSFTTILGLSSLIFFASGQALILQPMAVSLGFGILWATVLNLYYLPLVYSVIYLKDGKKYDYIKLVQTLQEILKINAKKLLKVISQKLNKV
jgi:multidrug efflux pump subunit AcrB